MKREFGEVHLTIPKLPQQLYAVVIVCQLPDDRKGRCVARIRKPEYLPLQYFPRNRVGCLKEKTICWKTCSILFRFGDWKGFCRFVFFSPLPKDKGIE